MAVDGAVIAQAQLFENHAGQQHALGGFFGAPRHAQRTGPAQFLHYLARSVVQAGIRRAGDDAVQIAGDGAHILIDRPLVVVQHHHQALGVVRDVIQSFVSDPAGKSGVAGQRHDMFLAAVLVASHRHAERGRERRARMARAVGVVRALGAQHKAVQPAGRADGPETLAAAGQHLVYVSLMADVEDKLVNGRVEDIVQGDGQLHHPQVRTQVPAVIGEHGDQLFADFRRQSFEVGDGELLDLLGGIDAIQYARHW